MLSRSRAGSASRRPASPDGEGTPQMPAEDQLDLDLVDAVAGLITRVIAEGEQVAKEFAVPPFFMKALHLIDGPLAMKELGQRMHCDPPFVTGIADILEHRGPPVRQPHPAYRRGQRP